MQTTRNPSNPAFNSAYQRCEQKSQHRRERERNKQLASDVKNRDDERRHKNHPDPYERRGRGILRSHGTLSVVHSAASSKCAARRPRTTAQFFEARKVSSDLVAIQKTNS